MFFSFRSHAEKTLVASRPPSMRRHMDSQSVSVCEVVSEGRCSCVRKNRAHAWARTCFSASSARWEPSAHGHVTSLLLVCASIIVATMHFCRSDFPQPLTHTETLCLYEILQNPFRILLEMNCCTWYVKSLQSFWKTFCHNQCSRNNWLIF